jgi:hypothetical protein
MLHISQVYSWYFTEVPIPAIPQSDFMGDIKEESDNVIPQNPSGSKPNTFTIS